MNATLDIFSACIALADQLTAGQRLVEEGLALNTRDAYRRDWQKFVEFTNAELSGNSGELLPISVDQAVAFIAWCVERGESTATIKRRVSTLNAVSSLHGHARPSDSPVVRAALRGVGRTLGSQQEGAEPLWSEALAAMLGACSLRDAATLAVGWGAALRSCEVAALLVDDITIVAGGAIVNVRRSKRDQLGVGEEVGIPRRLLADGPCLVELLEDWLRVRGPAPGSLLGWGTRREVQRVLERASLAAGYESGRWSGHSLRVGFASSAARAGCSARDIAEVTRHRSLEVLQRRYVKKATMFEGRTKL